MMMGTRSKREGTGNHQKQEAIKKETQRRTWSGERAGEVNEAAVAAATAAKAPGVATARVAAAGTAESASSLADIVYELTEGLPDRNAFSQVFSKRDE